MKKEMLSDITSGRPFFRRKQEQNNKKKFNSTINQKGKKEFMH